MDGAGVMVLVVLIFIIGAAIAYGVGYLWARIEFLRSSQRLEAERRMLPMEAPSATSGSLTRWRRVAGWAAYVFSALWLCLFLTLAYVYASRWGWAYLVAAWILWFAIFLGVLWLAEWYWKPGREVQTGASEEHSE